MTTIAIDEALNLFAKEQSLVSQWNNRRLYPKIKSITIALAQMLHADGYPLVVTSIWREDGGIHSEWRAVDCRCYLTEEDIAGKTPRFLEMEAIRNAINKRFPYGLKNDGTPGETCPPFDHTAAQSIQAVTAPHFHLQLGSGNLG